MNPTATDRIASHLAPRRPSPEPGRVVGRALRWVALASFAALVSLAPTPASAAAQASAFASTEAKPDFQLRDVNPNSPRKNQTVSPRDYRLQISAYYFGAAG